MMNTIAFKCSLTRWLELFLLFENVPYSIKMMYKVGSKYCQILSNLSKIAKRFLKCCHPNDL